MKICKSEVCLDGLRFYAYHGVLEAERRVGGWFTVSLRMELADGVAAQTDRVEDTVNYAEAFELVKREMAQPSALIEHVAGCIADAVLAAFPRVARVNVDVWKDVPPINGFAGNGAGVRIAAERQ